MSWHSIYFVKINLLICYFNIFLVWLKHQNNKTNLSMISKLRRIGKNEKNCVNNNLLSKKNLIFLNDMCYFRAATEDN